MFRYDDGQARGLGASPVINLAQFESSRQRGRFSIGPVELADRNKPRSRRVIYSVLQNAEMRNDTRFVGLCTKLGLRDCWVSTDDSPDCADAVAPYYDFKAEARRLVEV